MERDKFGRFIKKATLGTELSPDSSILTINGKQYKIKPEANQAFTTFKQQGSYAGTLQDWLQTDQGKGYLEEVVPGMKTGTVSPDGSTEKIKYTINAAGEYISFAGKVLSEEEVALNPDKYQFEFDAEKSSGVNIYDPLASYKNPSQTRPIDKTKIANFLDFARAGLEASTNNKIAKRALAAEKPFLQDVSESHRSIYGDYRAQVQGEKAAAKLRNMASKPMTSDGALQQQMMLDAQIKGQEYIDQGNAKDDAMIKQTREVAWQQEKEHQQQRQAVAMQNRQAMLMSEKNKANILNSRDSANYSQVVAPLLGGIEQRLRNEGKEQKAYQDYYDNAIAKQNVWNSYDPGLTDVQKELRNKYLLEGEMPTAPTVEDTNEDNRVFAGWDSEIVTATEDKQYI